MAGCEVRDGRVWEAPNDDRDGEGDERLLKGGKSFLIWDRNWPLNGISLDCLLKGGIAVRSADGDNDTGR